MGVITTGDITDGHFLYDDSVISTLLKTLSFQNSQHADRTHRLRLFLEHNEKTKGQHNTWYNRLLSLPTNIPVLPKQSDGT